MRHIARGFHGDKMEETCQYPWPENCHVQGGNDGIVFVKEDRSSYWTAFVEAFPENPSTFIRGEGQTVAEAETNCWEKYQKILTCPTHPAHGPFERRGYTNGLGFCTHCDMSASKVFEPIHVPNREPGIIEQIFTKLSELQENK